MCFIDQIASMRSYEISMDLYLRFPVLERLGCQDFLPIRQMYGRIVAICLHHDDVGETYIPCCASFFDDDGVCAGLSDLRNLSLQIIKFSFPVLHFYKDGSIVADGFDRGVRRGHIQGDLRKFDSRKNISYKIFAQ